MRGEGGGYSGRSTYREDYTLGLKFLFVEDDGIDGADGNGVYGFALF